ncbi:MAG TPA: carboxypeptidase-like regulatory domain-containing protein, partial [Bacteroidota bacterium]|nr:carboxypeptidase-like regulatory domain-containing protein [Bacteroidota bacterium]
MVSGRAFLIGLVFAAVTSPGVCRAEASHPAPDDPQGGTDVVGVVSDSATGDRVPGANVMLRGTKRGASTNNNGFYLISSVPPGAYEIVVSAVGFQRRVIPLTVREGGTQTVDIRIAPRLIETREVVVETQSISALAERSASIHVVTPKELAHLPAVGQQDLLRDLQILPGITSTSDVSAKFFVR